LVYPLVVCGVLAGVDFRASDIEAFVAKVTAAGSTDAELAPTEAPWVALRRASEFAVVELPR